MDAVQASQPSGGTPIVNTLKAARSDLEGLPGRKVVVLMTDGGETVYQPEDVVAELRTHRSRGIETYVVGYNLGEQGAYLERELGLNRGYFQANGGRDALLQAMNSILASIEK